MDKKKAIEVAKEVLKNLQYGQTSHCSTTKERFKEQAQAIQSLIDRNEQLEKTLAAWHEDFGKNHAADQAQKQEASEEALADFMKRKHFEFFGIKQDDSIPTEPNSWLDFMAKQICSKFRLQTGEIEWPPELKQPIGHQKNICGCEICTKVYGANAMLDACKSALERGEK